jgi:hypothetical protein
MVVDFLNATIVAADLSANASTSSADLANSLNSTIKSTNSSSSAYHGGHRDRIVFFEMHFESHQTQLTFAFWFFVTIVAKIGKKSSI